MNSNGFKSPIWLSIVCVIGLAVGCQRQGNDSNRLFQEHQEKYDKIVGTDLSGIFRFAALGSNQVNNPFNLSVVVNVAANCSKCLVEMDKWQEEAPGDDLLTRFNIIFVVSGEPNEEFLASIEAKNYQFEIRLDEDYSILNDNNLWNYAEEVLLLNPSNEITIVGSPLRSPEIRNLYQYVYELYN